MCIPVATVEVSVILREPKQTAVDDPPIDPGPHNGGTDDKIGNGDSCGDALWLVYENEAKDRDEQQFNIVKDDMDGVFLPSVYILSYYGQGYADACPTGWFVRRCPCPAHN